MYIKAIAHGTSHVFEATRIKFGVLENVYDPAIDNIVENWGINLPYGSSHAHFVGLDWSDTTDVTYVMFDNEDHEHEVILTHAQVYIMSDEGKTIDRV